MPGKISNFKFLLAKQELQLISNFQLPRRRQGGFTLVEVLIAISIIAVVFGVVASSMSAIQKKTRDVQRESDLRTIQSGLAQYYADRNYYPDSLTLSTLTRLTECDGDDTSCSTGSKTYLSEIPSDPNAGTTTPYCYISKTSANSNPVSGTSDCTYDDNAATTEPRCHFYRMYAKLEGSSGSLICGGQNTYSLEVTPLN